MRKKIKIMLFRQQCCVLPKTKKLCIYFDLTHQTSHLTLTKTLFDSNKHLFLQLHADGIGLFEEDGVAPQQIPERRELVETPFSERPHSQLGLTHRPRHWRAPHMTRQCILIK